MKSSTAKRVPAVVLTAGLGAVMACSVTGQDFKLLFSFGPVDCPPSGPCMNSDGFYPPGSVLSSGNALYGTALSGGTWGAGTVFTINTDGTGFFPLYSLTGGGDGKSPAALILLGSTLYGTTLAGGSSGSGTLFAANVDGSGLTTLYSFSATPGSPPYANNDGCAPSSLLVSGNTLYGTAGCGSSGAGTVFSINSDGTGFTTLHSFTQWGLLGSSHVTNSDGVGPQGLVLSGNTLYGFAPSGGSGGGGTLFAVNVDGSSFTNLHSFTAPSPPDYTNSEGAGPSSLLLSGNTLYGTTGGGGTWNGGTVFSMSIDGTGFAALHSFAPGAFDPFGNFNANPGPLALALSGTTLYGVTGAGGGSGMGTLFAVNTDGTGFVTLYSFPLFGNGPNEGRLPDGLVISGNSLYGTTFYGGSANNGTVFSFSLPILPPGLTITPSGPNVILSWPTNAISFTLQSTSDLSSPAWAPVSPHPVVVNGLNTVTNPISGAQQFYRLSQ